MRTIQIFFFAFVLTSLGAWAQSTDWERSQELMKKRNYALAQSHLSALSDADLTASTKISFRDFCE